MQGYRILNELDNLEPVLGSWIQVVRDIVTEWDRKKHRDVPWVHPEMAHSAKERVCVSLFAGAIWKLGGMCLEEFPDLKTNKDGSLYGGRVDLYGTVDGTEFTVEAKSVWSELNQLNDNLRELGSHLREACNDVKKDPDYPENRLFGMVFAIPKISAKASHPLITKCLQQWIEQFPQIKPDAFAYVFPKNKRMFLAKNGFHYPGVALLIKEVEG